MRGFVDQMLAELKALSELKTLCMLTKPELKALSELKALNARGA